MWTCLWLVTLVRQGLCGDVLCNHSKEMYGEEFVWDSAVSICALGVFLFYLLIHRVNRRMNVEFGVCLSKCLVGNRVYT